MAVGTKLLLNITLFHVSDLYLRPDGMRSKKLYRGCSGSLIIERAKRVMALLFISVRVGIGSPIILAAIRVILYSLFLLGMDSRVK